MLAAEERDLLYSNRRKKYENFLLDEQGETL